MTKYKISFSIITSYLDEIPDERDNPAILPMQGMIADLERCVKNAFMQYIQSRTKVRYLGMHGISVEEIDRF